MKPRSILILSALVILAVAELFLSASWQRSARPSDAPVRGAKPSVAVRETAALEPRPPVPSRTPDPSAPDPGAPGPRPAVSSALAVVPSASEARPLDEASLMAKLRELRGSDPALTLQLARDGNARFKDSPEAAERAWFVVKSLTDLGRHEEARAEGRRLLHDYSGSSWAEDAYRHLFVNPPTHPFERGYGKARELE